MSYVETSIIIAALDKRDPRCKDALSILESEEYKVVSELTLVELTSVLSRREDLIARLSKQLTLNRKLAILALLLYVLKRFKLKFVSLGSPLKATSIGRIYAPFSKALEIVPDLKLRTLDLLHIAYLETLKELGEPLHKLLTADTDFVRAEEYLRKSVGVKLQVVK